VTGETIRGDMSRRVWADTRSMAWSASPAQRVWRKRLHLVGAPESGQVTSIVRYHLGAAFPAHNHPDGEEILVLEGTFSDEHGDWPIGTYLLNPEGFRHAPFSSEGCLLFVKLRQYAGRDRLRVSINTNILPWMPTPEPGIEVKRLYSQAGYLDTTRLERWSANLPARHLQFEHGAEYLVLAGTFSDEAGTYPEGAWLRLPAGSEQRPRTSEGCVVYIKESGLPYLRSVAHVQ
jgi:anti-sigma factor ChrR (cupin superfamily)